MCALDPPASSLQDEKYEDTLKFFDALVPFDKPYKKILTLFDLAKGQKEMGEADRLDETAADIMTQIDSNMAVMDSDLAFDQIYKKLQEAVLDFIKIKKYYWVSKFLNYQLKLVKNFARADSKLIKLECIGFLMTELAEQLSKDNTPNEIKKYYILIDETLNEMRMTCTLDLEWKCKHVAAMLNRYGYYCIKANDEPKAIVLFNQAIVLMETVFGHKVEEQSVMGHCFKNLGVAYLNSQQPHQARIYFEYAVEIYEGAKDWEDDEVMIGCLTEATNHLKRYL